MEQPFSKTFDVVIEAAATSRRGLTHHRNEDAYLVDMEAGVFAVADGMGGHRDGHVASNAIMSILERTLDADADFTLKINNAARAVKSVNATLFAQSRDNPNRDISGSTFVSLIVGETQACCQWVGDSRLYLFRNGCLFLVSEDHAEDHGVLTRAVGSRSTVEIDRRIVDIQPDDIFLLCSDGLMKGVGEEQLADMLGGAAGGLADRLLAKAIGGGSTDDITLIVVWIKARDG